MPTLANKKYYVFIDAENVRNAIEEYGNSDMDYEKLYNWLIKSKQVAQIYLYIGIEIDDKDKEKKLKNLEKLGYKVNSKVVMKYKQKFWNLRTTCPACKTQFNRKTFIKDHKKANCDADMTLDIMDSGVRKKYRGIIVFSGDGDFASVYEYVVKTLKKKVIVYAPLGKLSKRTSLKVKELAKNKIITLEDLNSLSLHYTQ